ncbi:MAG: helix-turn-helix domain-containing protein [Oscillospiraceae bacterium]|jgi:excisionase family DNA binding protein|nr:helix-turn-helix domain-containing protein [Acidaminococcaceae bacterium]MBQ6281399.1 helix-turn-helix domain-containing protein [Oscillospiraceae bacterium]
MTKTSKEPNDFPLVLKVEELMSILSIGRNTAYELVRSGQISSIRIGRIYRIPRASLEEYLQKMSE